MDVYRALATSRYPVQGVLQTFIPKPGKWNTAGLIRHAKNKMMQWYLNQLNVRTQLHHVHHIASCYLILKQVFSSLYRWDCSWLMDALFDEISLLLVFTELALSWQQVGIYCIFKEEISALCKILW